MIEPTDEMVREFFRAATEQARKVSKARRPAEMEGSISRAGLAAVLAIVERDRCLAPAGHVWNPLAEPPPQTPPRPPVPRRTSRAIPFTKENQ